MLSPNRNTGSVATPSDCRAILARLASAMELAGGMGVETGWTVIYGATNGERLEAEIENALERGVAGTRTLRILFDAWAMNYERR